jgi:hypothetical protein
MAYQPVVYIDVGATGAFFTLRETYEHTRYIPDAGPGGNAVLNGVYQGSVEHEIRSFHHFNLSQNPDEAFVKAQAYADANAIQLDTRRDGLEEQLRNIYRSNAEQLAERERAAAARKAEWDAQNEERAAQLIQVLASGHYPIGNHSGKAFREAPVSYINWLINARETFEAGSLLRAIADDVAADCSDLILPVPSTTAVIGAPGERIHVKAVVVRVASYNTDYGRKYITTLVTDGGVCIVVKSTSFIQEVGDNLEFKATVKEHSEYKEQQQTVVQRVKIIGE